MTPVGNRGGVSRGWCPAMTSLPFSHRRRPGVELRRRRRAVPARVRCPSHPPRPLCRPMLRCFSRRSIRSRIRSRPSTERYCPGKPLRFLLVAGIRVRRWARRMAGRRRGGVIACGGWRRALRVVHLPIAPPGLSGRHARRFWRTACCRGDGGVGHPSASDFGRTRQRPSPRLRTCGGYPGSGCCHPPYSFHPRRPLVR